MHYKIVVQCILIQHTQGKVKMDISLIFKVAGVGLLVGILAQILNKYGRDEQAMFVGLAGILTVLIILVGEIGELFNSIREVFGL